MDVHATHEQWEGIENPTTATNLPFNRLEKSEHIGTYVDALNHMGKVFIDQSIDLMPLSMFYTEGICIDFSHKELLQTIDKEEFIFFCETQNIDIKKGDTVLIYTHYLHPLPWLKAAFI
jgi:kynurenine formamidase